MPVSRVCKTCGAAYTAPPSQKLYFCTQSCYDASKKGSGNPKWRGGKFICDGYRYIYSPDHADATAAGYVTEHRLVMEKRLGRRLTKQEVVHHRDGNKLNNRSRNLVLCRSTGHHSVEHHLNRDKLGRFARKRHHT